MVVVVVVAGNATPPGGWARGNDAHHADRPADDDREGHRPGIAHGLTLQGGRRQRRGRDGGLLRRARRRRGRRRWRRVKRKELVEVVVIIIEVVAFIICIARPAGDDGVFVVLHG